MSRPPTQVQNWESMAVKRICLLVGFMPYRPATLPPPISLPHLLGIDEVWAT